MFSNKLIACRFRNKNINGSCFNLYLMNINNSKNIMFLAKLIYKKNVYQ